MANPSDTKTPRAFIAIDDAGILLKGPEEKEFQLQLGDLRYTLITDLVENPTCNAIILQQDKFGKALEQLMHKDLKSRELPFIVVCRNPSIIYRFILERSALKMFFRLKTSWIRKLRGII